MNDGNVTEKAIFSDLNLKLGRWDQRRMYKVYDFVILGEKFVEMSEKLNVTLATQSSIEKIFSLVQGEKILMLLHFNGSTTKINFHTYFILTSCIVSHHWTGAISIAGGKLIFKFLINIFLMNF